MLLRLIPAPTASLPAPPTVLFTLPLQSEPYTTQRLPTPPALVVYQTEAVRERISFDTPFHGENSSWISSIIKEVTFDCLIGQAVVTLIDGDELRVGLSEKANSELEMVVDEVLATSPNAPAPSPNSKPYPCFNKPRENNPLISRAQSSWLKPTASQRARYHRKMARSLLVDAYRNFVLVVLKEKLPANYLTWAVRSELRITSQKWEASQTTIDSLLESAGVNSLSSAHGRSSSTETVSSTSSSGGSSAASSYVREMEISSPPMSPPPTPRMVSASKFPGRPSCKTAPSPASLPLALRIEYESILLSSSKLQLRITHLRKLITRIDREAVRKAGVQRKDDEKLMLISSRRAWSSGQFGASCFCPEMFTLAAPVEHSPLRTTTLPEVEEQGPQFSFELIAPSPVHPFISSFLNNSDEGLNTPPLSPSCSTDSSSSCDEDEFLSSDEGEMDNQLAAPVNAWKSSKPSASPVGLGLDMPETRFWSARGNRRVEIRA